ncbi:Crp/Fnr family transcriptional regulator [Cyclobacterium marinum]|uniref:Putative transcriptional regulator, Crp/Fnr family n=1 Tax=Cyclobacterium marinum (strain ATCC 25205 / DSM 745 / LMG 13164 / NCIMB 1802) TaxID=880070 RepID=G0J5E4_CYCMS|nr:Crp/Fnr family transcriptional regulator [Cyclobacterium marinum]AEL27580.1 putative transcriptional regulator, Crp/Fnr family [Cyclobacterium marinum DSM 745]MBI0397353.1 Crp/Fnr family transcriptional regulator [Cyclobacterium marinum]
MVDLNRLKQIYKFGKELSLKDIQVLLKAAKNGSFSKKELLINEGSKRNDVFYIKSGLVRCFNINDKGEEITLKLIPEHQVVANVDLILFSQASRYFYEALENTEVFFIDYDVLQDLVARNPKLEANRKYVLQRLLKESMERVESFVLLTPEERYQRFVKDYPGITNRVQDKYIANVLGITPVSLSRIRKRIASKY